MTSKTIRAAGALIAAAIAFAGAAQAAPDANNAAAANAEAARGTGDGAQDANDRRRYCIERPSTGTMLPTRMCKTRAEWARIGVQIPSRQQ
jgi:hypothetical protein